jgi:nitroreductase
MIRKALTSAALLFFVTAALHSQSAGQSVTDVILSGYSAKVFTTEPVSDKDIETILKCGIKAPSGMNKQPWIFVVVKDNALVNELVRNATEGNILIVICGTEPAQPGQSSDYDCGLATQNMYIAAQGLGLGAHIYMSSVGTINSTKKQAMGIPEGYKATAILRIGHIDTKIDAASSASTRKEFDKVVIYR